MLLEDAGILWYEFNHSEKGPVDKVPGVESSHLNFKSNLY